LPSSDIELEEGYQDENSDSVQTTISNPELLNGQHVHFYCSLRPPVRDTLETHLRVSFAQDKRTLEEYTEINGRLKQLSEAESMTALMPYMPISSDESDSSEDSEKTDDSDNMSTCTAVVAEMENARAVFCAQQKSQLAEQHLCHGPNPSIFEDPPSTPCYRHMRPSPTAFWHRGEDGKKRHV
jgi:hypothetical protein